MVFIHAKQDIARGVYQAASDHGMNLIVGNRDKFSGWNAMFSSVMQPHCSLVKRNSVVQ